MGLYVAGVAWAAPGDADSGKTLLTVRGKVRGNIVDFDVAALEALGPRQIRTRTQWQNLPSNWSGPPLSKVLAHVGATGDTLRLRALNDYSVTIPMSDVLRFDPILADKLDGKPISVRDRGPLIVIYPYDDFPELDSQVFHDRAAWQLRDITVE